MEAKGPLVGLKVASFTWAIVGSFITKYLADHGATVIHVENHTQIDVLRVNAPFKDNKPGIDRSGFFANYNTSKLGITLNLRKPQAREIATKLAEWADIFVENYSPGVMKKYGLDYETIIKVKPDIVYLSATGFGQNGPVANHLGMGHMTAALAGFPELTGWPDRSPSFPYGAYVDIIAPRFLVFALMAALDYKRRTGKGIYLDSAQYETALQMLAPVMLDYSVNKHVTQRSGNRISYAAPHGVYPCQGEDAWCTIAVFTDAEWQACCQAIDRPEWGTDPRFATLMSRKKNEDELDQLIATWTTRHSPEEVMNILQGAGVDAGIARSGKSLFEDPQLKHRHHFNLLNHPKMGAVAYDHYGFRLSKTPASLSPSPCIGEHNRYVYREILGLSDKEIDRLMAEHVITTDADLPVFTPIT